MADVKISGLPASTVPLAGTEVLPIVQSSTTKKVSIANVTAGRAVSALSFAPTGSALPVNGLFLPDTNAVGISTNSEERARFFASGGVSIGNTTDPGATNLSVTGNVVQKTAAKGINFTANTPAAGMTSQLLNWYEEGTFTPVYSQISGGAITYTTQTGSYVRIGRQVTAYFLITVNTNTHTVGNAAVTLPFTAGFTGRLGFVTFNNTATALLATFNVVSGNTFAYPNTTAGAALSAASITNGSTLSGTIIYFV